MYLLTKMLNNCVESYYEGTFLTMAPSLYGCVQYILATCQVTETRVGKSGKMFPTGTILHKNIRQHVYIMVFLTNTIKNA